jgi:hypothetical protein
VSTRFSPDGLYYWDGQTWQSTLSPDGRFRWDGSGWVPTGTYAPAAAYARPGRVQRFPTSWTRPLQYSVAGWYAIQGMYALSIPFWMGSAITQVVNQSIQRQEQLNPSASPPPEEFANAMNSLITGGLWVGALFGFALSLVVIIGALNRWTWLYYVVLVLLGLGAISLPLNLVNAVSGPSSVSSSYSFVLPAWTYAVSLVLSIPGTALFVWMLVALAKRGPWGMAKAAPVVS